MNENYNKKLNIKLLNKLLNDEKKSNQVLYSSGPYWNHKNKKTTFDPKKLNEFFDNKLEIEWHDFLIKDYKRLGEDNSGFNNKSIFLVSNNYLK